MSALLCSPDLGETTAPEPTDVAAFDLPCGIQHDGQECTEVASWWAEFSGHCRSDAQDKLMCDEHYEFVQAGGKGLCTTCRAAVVVLGHVLRLEQIKP